MFRWSFVALCILINWTHPALAIYFSQSGSLDLSLGFWPENSTIHVVRALLEPDDSGHILYSILSKNKKDVKDVNCPDLFIHPQLGFVSIHPSYKYNEAVIKKDKDCLYKVVAELKGKPGIRRIGREELELNLRIPYGSTSQSQEACSTVSYETLCFGGFSSLDLSVMENSESLSLADFGQLNQMCGTLLLNYSIKSEVLTIYERKEFGKQSFSVKSNANLDRETVALYNFTLECDVIAKENSKVVQTLSTQGTLTVLDQNDNLIMRHDGSRNVVVFISFSEPENKFQPGIRLIPVEHSALLAQDKDTKEVNHFSAKCLNDSKGLLDVSVSSYNSPVGPVISSAVLLKLKLSSKAGPEMGIWTNLYCVAIDVNDAKLTISNPPMRYVVCLHWGKHTPTLPTHIVPMVELLPKLLNGTVLGTLSRSAADQSRVMSTFPQLATDFSQLSKEIQFSLKSVDCLDNENKTVTRYENSDELPFGVTAHSGILYLVDSNTIKDEKINSFGIQLFYTLNGTKDFTANLTVFLKESLTNSSNGCNMEYCAEFSDDETCESSCGFGSNGNCIWSKNNSPKNLSLEDVKEQDFSTCTPDLITCPDGICDELEQQFPHICPQDCTKEILGFGVLKSHENGQKYGVVQCTGVCTCHESKDSFSCTCGSIPISISVFEKDKSKDSKSRGSSRDTSDNSISYNVLDHSLEVFETAESKCGQQCILMYTSASGIGTVLIISIILFSWKRKGKKKRKSTQSVVIDASDVELASNYGNSGGNRNLISEIEYIGPNSNGFNSTNAHFDSENFCQVESKWVIPREDLLLEHVLGEGEFGRVLKGILRSVTGTIHVAVKMLKIDQADGNKSLRQEFMAEFSLLKQLDHPNVIKLLGACTSNGGPPYLVMEYAEFGSLRSFLRKCRRIESINHQKSSEPDWGIGDRRSTGCVSIPAEFEYVVTPQEVLGFSWQIAKGMAYLSDMKMVHRDLAARNILLTKTKVCKISDFGLTRDIYVDDAYRKKSKDRVPVKWLAPECLTDELYTSKSDVWAFGILLWELTTLGTSPYPGVQTELLYSLLDSGYRMQQPVNCSNEVYTIMRKCWSKHVIDRPTFHELVYELSRLLENGIEYLKLDIPSVSNPGYDIFMQQDPTLEASSSQAPTSTPGGRSENSIRRNSSMENLRLIDYEICTTDDSEGNLSISQLRRKHTYINNPNGSQDCETSDMNSSGYESPITLSTG